MPGKPESLSREHLSRSGRRAPESSAVVGIWGVEKFTIWEVSEGKTERERVTC
jgi:hypothetical protein